MKSITGESFVARFDYDNDTWVGFSGFPYFDNTIQYYLNWASTSLCSAKTFDAIVIEVTPAGCILRANGNQSEPIQLNLDCLRKAETGIDPVETVLQDVDDPKYRSVAAWVSDNYKLILKVASIQCRKLKLKWRDAPKEVAQEVTSIILKNWRKIDEDRGNVDAWCRMMIRYKTPEAAFRVAPSHDGGNSSVELQIAPEAKETISAVIPEGFPAKMRWALETYAKGHTIAEMAKVAGESDGTIHALLENAKARLRKYYGILV